MKKRAPQPAPTRATFESLTLQQLAEWGEQLANMKQHPGWGVLMALLDRLDHDILELGFEDDPANLAEHRGELNAVRKLRFHLEQLPARAEEAIESAVEEGSVDEAELASYAFRGRGGDIPV